MKANFGPLYEMSGIHALKILSAQGNKINYVLGFKLHALLFI